MSRGLGIAAAVLILLAAGCKPGSSPGSRRSPGASAPPTYNTDIAPLVARHCAACHRPGQTAPFDLLTYADARKRARQIAEVTARRFMPPWLPDASAAPLQGDRRLTDAEVALLQKWADAGAPEGDPAMAPTPPRFTNAWALGKPDLIVRPAAAFPLVAEGPDVYRNLVVRLPVTNRVFVRAVDFHPGDSRAVHHALFSIDRTAGSRERDGRDGRPGFPGLSVPPSAESPGGHFLGWQPGRTPFPSPKGLEWVLEPGTDLIVQIHLRPTGRPEQVLPEIAFYFTPEPPTNRPLKLFLSRYDIDLPAGASNVVVRDQFTLPADADLFAVLPHAHFLARSVRGTARLPDGSRLTLLNIPDWDFAWQGDYRYTQPVFLPAGSVLVMEWTFDNSAANPRNPHQPPQRVQYGVESGDEMAEFWLQILPRTPAGRASIEGALAARVVRDSVAYYRFLVGKNPIDPIALVGLARALHLQGDSQEALTYLQRVFVLAPQDSEAPYWAGLALRHLGNLDGARQALENCVRLNPANARAHGTLGLIATQQNRLADAERHLRTALQLDPTDEIARTTLGEILAARKGSP